MFNLFKKEEPKTSYPTIVEEIHNEFYTAGDNILQEATCLLKELEQKDLTKGKRLASLGFGKTREAVSAIEAETKLATTKQIAELVVYYQRNYPNNKFITEEQVKHICEKYGLICGDTSMYKGFVPTGKLDLIEKFKLKDCDIIKHLFEITENHNGDNVVLPISHITDKDLTEFGLRDDSGYFYICHSDGSTGMQVKEDVYNMFKGLKFVKATRVDSKLKICAPAKDMEIPEGKQVVGYKIQDIPDPVVLQPVRGGFLVVACWGDEASDEIVVNQKMN